MKKANIFGRFRTWMRRGLFSDEIFFLLIFMILCHEVFEWFREEQQGISRWDNPTRLTVGAFFVAISSLVYGGIRAMGHPCFHLDYRNWLSGTPWRPGLPLPLTDPKLMLQDLVALGISATLMGLHAAQNPFYGVVALLFGYLLILSIALIQTGVGHYAFTVLVGMGLAIRLIHHPMYSALVMMGTQWIGQMGLSRSMALFPWPGLVAMVKQIAAGEIVAAPAWIQGFPRKMGWPFDQLRPLEDQEIHYPSSIQRIAVAILVGWWLYVIMAVFPEFAHASPVILGLVAFWPSLMRLTSYLSDTNAPINFWGRLRINRWIIRGFDQVFVAPILAILIAGFGMWSLFYFQLPKGIAGPIFIASTLAASQCIGPKLGVWTLTGKFRVADSVYKVAKQFYTQVG